MRTTVPIEKKVTKNISYNFLIVQGLWQDYYQISSIIFLKEFIKLNVNMDTMIKSVKLAE